MFWNRIDYVYGWQDCIYREELYDRSWKDPPIVPKCLSSQLRTCSLTGYKGKELELQFAKYILQNSKVLQTMTVKCSRLIDLNAKQQMLMYLSSLPRGSSTCKLLSDWQRLWYVSNGRLLVILVLNLYLRNGEIWWLEIHKFYFILSFCMLEYL